MTPDENITLKSMPHSVGAEKAVLSVIFQYPEKLHEFPEIGVRYFYLPAHQTLFEVFTKTIAAGKKIEFVSLTQSLLDSGDLEAIGGPGFMAEIWSYQPVVLHFEEHLETLRVKMANRMMIEIANEMITTAHQAPSGEEMMECTGKPITALHDALTGSKPAPDAKQLGKDWWENYLKLVKGEKIPMGIQTGIHEIDQALRGLHPGMMGVISAKSSGGKSTLATQIMCGVASPETPVVYLPLEGTVNAAYTRCVIQLTKLEATAIASPREHAQLNGRDRPSEKETEKISQALKRLISGGFHFDPPINRRIQTIVSTIRRAHRMHGIKVAMIDYVQLIWGEKGQSKEQEIMGISNMLQSLAAELGIFIALMSQENADGDTKHARAIEEDSDWTISIVQHQDRNKENYKEHRHILVTKDRHNGNGGVKLPLILDKKHVRFITGEEKQDEEKPRSNWDR